MNRPRDITDKYREKRHSLFWLFDLGIELDDESWFSVTPEAVARHHAQRCCSSQQQQESVMVDACCGVGGNAIQMAQMCSRVIAVDIDETKLTMGRNNATIYGVADRIQWVCADFNSLVKEGLFFSRLCVDGVFISPPWGGPSYVSHSSMMLSDMPIDGALFWRSARALSPNVAMFLPRNLNVESLRQLTPPDEMVEVERNHLNGRLISLTAYWGNFVKKK